MPKRLFLIVNNQNGFTLVELLISLVIAGIIGVVIVATTLQIFIVSAADSDRMEAVKQVENALHWINRDAQMAFPNSFEPPAGDFTDLNPLKLGWKDYTDPGLPVHSVTYSLDSDHSLIREDDITGQPATITKIADYIDPETSYFYFDGVSLTINLTSRVEGLRSASETRTFYVKSRINPSPD